jgi:hypothetical protein
MNEHEPLTEDEYREYMDLLKEGSSGDPAKSARSEELWNRHFAHVQLIDFERTAIHEAGHAVVGHALGSETQYLAILDDGNGEALRATPITLGLSQSALPRAKFVELLDYAAMEVAGYVAEEIEWGRARYPEQGVLVRILSRWDRISRQIQELAVKDWVDLLPEPPKEPTLIGVGIAIVQQGEHRAANILRRNWSATRRLADALLDKRRLEGAELVDLIANVRMSDGPEPG